MAKNLNHRAHTDTDSHQLINQPKLHQRIFTRVMEFAHRFVDSLIPCAYHSSMNFMRERRPLASLCLLGLTGLLAHPSLAAESYTENPGTEGNGNFTVGPEYKIDRDLTDLGNPKGKSFEFSLKLADSKIFRGDDQTLDPVKKPVRTERKIFVYVPAAYRDGTPAPLLVIHDGPGQLSLVRNALDNLTISKDPNRKLPAFIAIAVQNGGNDGKNSERGLEYDTLSDRLARFIHGEVLPAVLANAEIKAAYPKLALTQNPWGRAVIGCSSGGAAALSMGWFRPDLFRRIIAYSGTFVDQQDDDAAEEAKFPLGAWEYHSSMKLIQTSENKPLRIFTHVSENDNRAKDPESTYHNWVMAGERTAAALKAKGYQHRYVFSKATGHCDRRVFEQTLADTLVWVWRGYHD
jgi:enterochelin esterase family protein